ncbi:roadblock/LC7 domain-containing protein [Acinetobacter bohemicus]|uniref:roadblock/LC7 domain-containing protein n=1 Tax=Acinetobacter bohemicus TaxID=1435036 RepID=UPI0040429495
MLQQRSAPDSLIHTAHQQIKEILTNVSGVEYVMICSSDGFELTSAYKKNVTNTGKLAAVSSSILAMVQAFLAEIDLHGCQSITLEAENGKAFLSAVPNKNYPMLIVALTSQEVLLGQLLFSLKRCSEKISQADAHYTSEY